MKEFTESMREWFKERTSSPLYFTYIIFLIFWNWEFFHILFLEDSELLISPRIEYISENLYFDFQFVESGIANSSFNGILNAIWHLVPPILLTYFAIVYLPRIHNWAHGFYLKYHFERKESYDVLSLQYNRRKADRLGQKAMAIERQQKEKQKIDRSLSQEEKWDEEVREFIKDVANIVAIKEINKIIYVHHGWINTNAQTASNYYNPAFLSRLDSIGVLKLSEDNNRVSFTEKGRYFMMFLHKQNII